MAKTWPSVFIFKLTERGILMNSPRQSQEKKVLSADDVADILEVSRSTAYRIIHKLNDDLNKSGKITVSGKVSSRYFFENVYL